MNGQPFTLSSRRGKVLILYFGYTNCQTECSLSMAHLTLAVQELGDKAAEVCVLMVTTDPARDSPQAMQGFLGKFGPSFLGLLGTSEELGQAWKACGVTVESGGRG